MDFNNFCNVSGLIHFHKIATRITRMTISIMLASKKNEAATAGGADESFRL